MMPPTFKRRVYAVVKKIKRGEVLTYKQVAEKAGSPNAYRAVGNILHRNDDPRVPCHRVIRSDGSVGGYNRDAQKKRERLKIEGSLQAARGACGSPLSDAFRNL